MIYASIVSGKGRLDIFYPLDVQVKLSDSQKRVISCIPVWRYRPSANVALQISIHDLLFFCL